MFDLSKLNKQAAAGIESAPSLTHKHWQKDWHLISCVVAVLLLLLGFEEAFLPSDFIYHRDGLYELDEPYFAFLHLYVTGLALVLTYTFWRRERAISLVVATLVVILFNPLLPLEIEDWTVFYFVVAAWFAYAAMLAPSMKKVRANTSQANLGSAVAAPDANPSLEAMETDRQDPVTTAFEGSAEEHFDGKRLRTNLYWGVTIATMAEFFLRSVLSSGEDRGTNVLSFAIIAIICWLIGKSTHRTTAAIWTFAAASLVFLAISLFRYAA